MWRELRCGGRQRSRKRLLGVDDIIMTHSSADPSGYSGILAGHATASTALPNSVVVPTHSLLVCRLLPLLELPVQKALFKRLKVATRLLSEIT